MGKGTMTIKFKTLATVGFLTLVFIVSGFITFGLQQSIKSDWTNFQEEISERRTVISLMKNEIGYGGLIHNFKNYVLRGTQKHFDRVENQYQSLLTHIESYRKLGSISPEESKALDAIQTVFTLYYDARITAKDFRYAHHLAANLSSSAR